MFEELHTTLRILIVAVAGVAAILVARPQLLGGESQLRLGRAPAVEAYLAPGLAPPASSERKVIRSAIFCERSETN
jgi:hypothetical protein